MIIIFSLVAVIAAISVYDYFSTRSWQQVTSDTRNETVFEHRNRSYGAYRIRRDYNKVVMVILLGITAGAGVLYASIQGREPNKRILPETDGPIIYCPIGEAPDDPEVIYVKNEDQPQAIQQTVAFVEPVITDVAPVEGPEIIDPNIHVSNRTITDPTGEEHFTALPPGTHTTPVTVTESVPTGPAEPIDLDEQPMYPGGPQEMKKFLANNLVYPQIAVELELEGKCYIQFVVSKTGEISEIKVNRGVEGCPECDKEAVRVVKKMPKWFPGKINGKAVDAKFNLPVKFELKG